MATGAPARPPHSCQLPSYTAVAAPPPSGAASLAARTTALAMMPVAQSVGQVGCKGGGQRKGLVQRRGKR